MFGQFPCVWCAAEHCVCPTNSQNKKLSQTCDMKTQTKSQCFHDDSESFQTLLHCKMGSLIWSHSHIIESIDLRINILILTIGDKGLGNIVPNWKYLWPSLFFNLGTSVFLPLLYFSVDITLSGHALRTSRKVSVVWQSTEEGGGRAPDELGRRQERERARPCRPERSIIFIWRTKGTAWGT